MSGESIGMFLLSATFVVLLVVCVLCCDKLCKEDTVPGLMNHKKLKNFFGSFDLYLLKNLKIE